MGWDQRKGAGGAMDEVIIIALMALLLLAVIAGWYFYDTRVAKPKNRLKALEKSLDAIATHNVEIAYSGRSKRIEQLKRMKKGETTPLSVVDALNRDSRLNKNGEWLKLEFFEGLHQGPFDDELTKDEWQFVQRRYSELVEEKTTHRMSVETQQRLLHQNEDRMNRLTSSYVEEAKKIAEHHSGDQRKNTWDAQFDALDEDPSHRP